MSTTVLIVDDDPVQRRLADGRAAPGMAATLASLGIGYLVVRNDLSVDSAAPRPACSPGCRSA